MTDWDHSELAADLESEEHADVQGGPVIKDPNAGKPVLNSALSPTFPFAMHPEQPYHDHELCVAASLKEAEHDEEKDVAKQIVTTEGLPSEARVKAAEEEGMKGKKPSFPMDALSDEIGSAVEHSLKHEAVYDEAGPAKQKRFAEESPLCTNCHQECVEALKPGAMWMRVSIKVTAHSSVSTRPNPNPNPNWSKPTPNQGPRLGEIPTRVGKLTGQLNAALPLEGLKLQGKAFSKIVPPMHDVDYMPSELNILGMRIKDADQDSATEGDGMSAHTNSFIKQINDNKESTLQDLLDVLTVAKKGEHSEKAAEIATKALEGSKLGLSSALAEVPRVWQLGLC